MLCACWDWRFQKSTKAFDIRYGFRVQNLDGLKYGNTGFKIRYVKIQNNKAFQRYKNCLLREGYWHGIILQRINQILKHF